MKRTDGVTEAGNLEEAFKPGSFFDKTYAIPEDLTRGKQKVEVRFRAHPDNTAGGLFGARILRARP